MMYALKEILCKLGAPEVQERGRIEWHYFNKEKSGIAGYAEIRLQAGGEELVAEMRHIRENFEDDEGKLHPVYTESFYLFAERTARAGYYRVTKLSLDGEDYSSPQKGVVELGLSVFHARALDISIRMVEQAFNKQDIVEPKEPPRDPAARLKAVLATRRAVAVEKEEWGVVVPFRSRSGLHANSA